MSDAMFAGVGERPRNVQGQPYYSRSNRLFYRVVKRLTDISISLILLPLLAFICASVWVLNKRLNYGPLFYTQKRMGRHCRPIYVIKLRTMLVERRTVRRVNDPLEHDRIRPFGRFLRKLRLDELPQILNVLRGDMSLIGPRPDTWDHAREFIELIPEYPQRHTIKPGISGLAQTKNGYAEGIEATRAKVHSDLEYIRRASLGFDLWLIWRTLVTVVKAEGI